jgi:hypothetical protein
MKLLLHYEKISVMAENQNPILKPIVTCLEKNCNNCSLSDIIHCHFTLSQYIKFMISSLPSLILGAFGIIRLDNRFLIPWILFCVIFFSLIETRVLCSHCPHYGEQGIFLRCWAARGLLKLWRWRLGPLSTIEKVVLLGGFVLIWSYPLPFLIFGSMWFLLGAYILASVSFFGILQWQFCRYCINLYCPLNSVPGAIKSEFYKKNPSVEPL